MRYGIAVILVIIFAIAAIILFSRGGNDSTQKSTTQSRSTKLADYADKDGASVSWTMQGRLVGEDKYKAVRVTVTRRSRVVEILSGYGNTTERKTEYGNTSDAYETFLLALDNANFGRERSVRITDERGICPLGNRFIYRLEERGSEVMRTWSDTCLVANGPFAGNSTLIAQLFRNQITDYNKFTSNVQF